MTGSSLPLLKTSIPGPLSARQIDTLAQHECPAITARRARRADALGLASSDPVVWSEAVGANVLDVDGNTFVDMTSGFGVALIGHRRPEVVRAAHLQSQKCLHAMGDAWPDATRIALLKRLGQLAPGELRLSILGLSGADAIDAAIKTALLATKRPGVLTFSGGYHGLSLGTVPLQAYKAAFSSPFKEIIHPHTVHHPWGGSTRDLADIIEKNRVGFVLAEPVQGRGGMRTAPSGWLAEVAQIARKNGALFGLDEIQSGLGRTGRLFALEDEGLIPDLLLVGKALAGGFPLSACIGTPKAMNAWGASKGEALHTQTFLGHPVGCAAALATLNIIEDEQIPQMCRKKGALLQKLLGEAGFSVRGRGLMLGVELGDQSLPAYQAMVQRGFIVLPAGINAEVLALTPPAVIHERQLIAFVQTLREVIDGL